MSEHRPTRDEQIRDRQREANQMLKRALHMEKRAKMAKQGSNERESLHARARELRKAAAMLHGEISAILADKLVEAGSRRAERSRA